MRILVKVTDKCLKPLQRLNIPEGSIVELEINTRKWFEEITEKTKDLVRLPGKYFPDYLIDKLYVEYLHVIKRVKSSKKECKDAVALFFACRKLGIPCKIRKISYRSLRKLLEETPPLPLTHYLNFVLKSLEIDGVLREAEVIEALKKLRDCTSLTTLGAVLYILANRKEVCLTQKKISEVLVVTPTGLRKKIKEIKGKI